MSNPQRGAVQPILRLAPLGELRVYQISEAELDTMAIGGPDPLFLNFTMFFLSSFISFLVTLLSANDLSNRLFLSFLTICLISGIAALVLGALWLRSRVSSRKLVAQIKMRMPPPQGFQEVA